MRADITAKHLCLYGSHLCCKVVVLMHLVSFALKHSESPKSFAILFLLFYLLFLRNSFYLRKQLAIFQVLIRATLTFLINFSNDVQLQFLILCCASHIF